MKLLKPFFIFAVICCIHARKVEYEDLIKDIEELNEIDFEDILKEAKFHITIDEKDEHISKSTNIYDEVIGEIEGINDDSENTRDRLNDLRAECEASNWSAGLASTINGVFQTIFGTAANAIDTAVNTVADKFNQGISASLNFTDRVHTQKKLLIAKVQKCAEQQGLSAETLSEDAYANIETCVPKAVESINATAQTIMDNFRNVRGFMSNLPNSVNECVDIMRNAKKLEKLTASPKTIFCLGGVTGQVGVESAQLTTKLITCGVKAEVSFYHIQRELRFCYMDGLEAIVKEAQAKGIELKKCVLRNETKKVE
ncbi:uncharacterized protein LOC123305941 [Chrysoperla carnea]|uniref:uncharacterized protein LOC123305941 n=1 Tax=Chrysoperla carnea TaxID=189513 RepID=UPI001D06D14A|nr:uncharacterized protein LOC123305941 [Chrysoperla carnea]